MYHVYPFRSTEEIVEMKQAIQHGIGKHLSDWTI